MAFLVRLLPPLIAGVLSLSVAHTAVAYITPSEFLDNGGVGQGNSSSAPQSPEDILIPQRVPLAPAPPHDDPRASVLQSTGRRSRPQELRMENLPEDAGRSIRIPNRPASKESTEYSPSILPIRQRPSRASGGPLHSAAPLTSTGLPLALPLVFSMLFAGGIFFHTIGHKR